jgi:hypothetical protein
LDLQRVLWNRVQEAGMRTGFWGFAALLAGVAASGCSSGDWFVYVNPTSSPAFTAFIRPATAGISGVSGQLRVPCDVVISASRTVDVQEVTIRLIDGSSLGGPMMSFPQPQLSSQFGSTRAAPSTSSGSTIVIGVSGVDSSAKVHRVTVERPWP